MANILLLDKDQIETIYSMLSLIPRGIFGNAILSLSKKDDNQIYAGIEAVNAAHEYIISFDKPFQIDNIVYEELETKRYAFFCTDSILNLFKTSDEIILSENIISAQKRNSKGNLTSEVTLTLVNDISDIIEVPHTMKELYDVTEESDSAIQYAEVDLSTEDIDNVLSNINLLEKPDVFTIKTNAKGDIIISSKDFTKSQMKVILESKYPVTGITLKLGEPLVKILKEMKKFKDNTKKLHLSSNMVGFIIDDNIFYAVATLEK